MMLRGYFFSSGGLKQGALPAPPGKAGQEAVAVNAGIFNTDEGVLLRAVQGGEGKELILKLDLPVGQKHLSTDYELLR